MSQDDNDIMYKQMDIGALSLNKSRLPGPPSVTFCPEHEYFILSLTDSSVSQHEALTRLQRPSAGSLFINCLHENSSEDESQDAESP